jgi:hypothetical protein
MTKAKPGDWNPLEDAKWFIDELSKEIDKCNATGMAARSAGAFGNLEAAFYRNDINEDTMVSMKDNVGRLINQFDKKCECRHKT